MNKKDYILIGILIIISLLLILVFNSKPKYAYVYYEDELIKIINLNKDNIYEVKGYNGIVKIEVFNNKIRVIEETSNNNICSNMGFVSSPLEPIICIPNKIVIKIIEDIELDAIVR